MKSFITEMIKTLIVISISIYLIHISIGNFQVQMSSMSPTLTQGQRIIANKIIYQKIPNAIAKLIPGSENENSIRYLFRQPKSGEIVVFRFQDCNINNDCVKRIIGVPGDTIKIVPYSSVINGRSSATVFLNGSQITESYVKEAWYSEMREIRIGQDEYFLLGDNRNRSNDSRKWGPIPTSKISSKVWIIYWPFADLQFFNTSMWAKTILQKHQSMP